MPLNDARTLSRETSADLLAYILETNHMPPGKTELPHEPQMLRQIRMDPTKPE
jgi:hypothetical protein